MEDITVFCEGYIKCVITVNRNYDIVTIRLFSGRKQMKLSFNFFLNDMYDNNMIRHYVNRGKERCKIRNNKHTFDMSLDVTKRLVYTTRDFIQQNIQQKIARSQLQEEHPGQVLCQKTNQWEELSMYMMKCLTAPLYMSLTCRICWHCGLYGPEDFICFGRCTLNGRLYEYFDKLDKEEQQDILNSAFIDLDEENVREISDMLQYDFTPSNILEDADAHKSILFEVVIKMLRDVCEGHVKPAEFMREMFGIDEDLPLICGCD